MATSELLQNTLGSLLDTNLLLSWTIYTENNGNICLKVRLSGDEKSIDGDPHTSQPVKPARYKLKSQNQTLRDHRRSQAWKAKQSTPRTQVANRHGVSSPVAPSRHDDNQDTVDHDVLSVPDSPVGVVTRGQLRTMEQQPSPEIPRVGDQDICANMDTVCDIGQLSVDSHASQLADSTNPMDITEHDKDNSVSDASHQLTTESQDNRGYLDPITLARALECLDAMTSQADSISTGISALGEDMKQYSANKIK